MKYIDEYRDPDLARALIRQIEQLSRSINHPVTIMEICGSHTAAIARFGIRHILPSHIQLLSGPGCPVCVTSPAEIDAALHLACQDNILFATFGDMIRVPATGGISLQTIRSEGRDIRIVLSPLDALRLAEKNHDRQVVFMGIGFETTAPAIAAVMQHARKKNQKNFSVLSVLKIIPPVLNMLVDDPGDLQIDGFLCPGHVSMITGADIYQPLSAAGKAAVITGFEAVDILQGIVMILEQIVQNQFSVALQYSRGLKSQGNERARMVMADVFETTSSQWRGMGWLDNSGLVPAVKYQKWDAWKKFAIPSFTSTEPNGCSCGAVIRGIIRPVDCPLFKTSCTPLHPVGPCMVSSEGTCAAYFKYNLN
jgi:hydrogenase expression/formation protein HypD